MLEKLQAGGTLSGAKAATTAEQFLGQMQTAMRDSRAAGLKATQTLAESYAALVSGVLIGMSDALTQRPAEGRGKEERAPAPGIVPAWRPSDFSFFWHDYETFGRVPRRDRPAQFAGVRTDADLNEIDAPLMLYCQPPLDALPEPGLPADRHHAAAVRATACRARLRRRHRGAARGARHGGRGLQLDPASTTR